MSSEHYSRVIQEWCTATGMPTWSEHEDMHVEIGDTLVGLIHTDTGASDALHVYIDLGHLELPELHRTLLEQNVAPQFSDQGCFGLHPLTSSIVYRTTIILTENTNGASLPQELNQLIDSIRERLETSLVH